MTWFEQFIQFHKQDALPRAWELLRAPGEHPEMIWTIMPILLTLLLMQLYFGRYKTEELGWNTAFANTITLFFVTTQLFRKIFYLHPLEAFFVSMSLQVKLSILVLMAITSIILAVSNYYHAMPKRLGFILSSSVTINVAAFVMTVLVFSDIILDLVTAYAAFLCLLAAYPFFAAFRAIVEPSPGTKAALTRKEREEQQKRYYMKYRLKKQLHEQMEWCNKKVDTITDQISCWMTNAKHVLFRIYKRFF